MFTLKIENIKNNILELTQNESDFQIVNISGLNPSNAQINRSTVAGLDGSRFNSSKLEERNIVITLKLNGDIAQNRIRLYSYFNTKQWCKLYYQNELRNVYIEGWVETVEVDLFTNSETMQISIVCPNPYFKALDEIITDVSKVIEMFTFPFAIDLELTPTTGDILPLAELKEQLLALTSYLETSTTYPNNFGITTGNFDGAGISWGAIQYNFGQMEDSNTLSPIWRDLINNYPDVCKACFSNISDYDWWTNLILTGTYTQLKTFGTNITDSTNNHKVIEPWNTNFTKLGMTQEGIERQVQGANWYYNEAVKWFNEFGLWSRRGLSLCFDIAIQSGSISQTTKDLINADFTKITATTKEEIETKKLIIIANRRADAVSIEWQETYRERKLAIANGSGGVYGGTLPLNTADFNMILEPAFVGDSEGEYKAVGIVFSRIETSLVTNVVNDSESETGIIIDIEFINDVRKLQILNTGTGETFTLIYNFITNDQLIIDTNKGNKSIRLIRNGKEMNIFNSIQKGSTFFQLNVGDNFFSYLADDGLSDENIVIVFKHYTIYGGV